MFGSVCRQCWDTRTTWLLLAGVVVVFVGFMALVSLSSWMQAHDDSSIALKLLIGFVQAVSSLSVFTAGGAALFRSAFGWTSYASASPFSLGALQCQLQWGVLARYVAMVSLPGVGVACAAGVAGIVMCGRSTTRWHGVPVGCSYARWETAMRGWVDTRRHMATFVLLAFLCYMPIVTASFDVLMCGSEAVDGAYWLASDLSVQCYVGQHAVTMVVAVIVLVLVGLGTPVLIVRLLGRVHHVTLREASFVNAYAFLYQGYARTADMTTRRATLVANLTSQGALSLLPPESPWRWLQRCFGKRKQLLWWEAVVLLRKASIVMLATVVTDKFYQVVGAVLLFAGSMTLQQHFSPYARPLFNHLEQLSLADLYVTAAVSTVMLPVAAVPANVARTPSAWETGLTSMLVLLNVGTFVLLTGLFLLKTALCTGRVAAVSWRTRQASSASWQAVEPPPPAFPIRQRRGGANFMPTAAAAPPLPPTRRSVRDGGGHPVKTPDAYVHALAYARNRRVPHAAVGRLPGVAASPLEAASPVATPTAASSRRSAGSTGSDDVVVMERSPLVMRAAHFSMASLPLKGERRRAPAPAAPLSTSRSRFRIADVL